MKRVPIGLLILASYPVLASEPSAPEANPEAIILVEMAEIDAVHSTTTLVQRDELRQQANSVTTALDEEQAIQLEQLAQTQARTILGYLKLDETKQSELEAILQSYLIVRHSIDETLAKKPDLDEKFAARRAARRLDSTLEKALSGTIENNDLLFVTELAKFPTYLNKSIAALQKKARKEEQFNKTAAKQTERAIKQLKLSEEQKSQLELVIQDYFAKRVRLVDLYEWTDQYEFTERISTKSSLKRLDSKLRRLASTSLDETQQLALQKMFNRNNRKLGSFGEDDARAYPYEVDDKTREVADWSWMHKDS